MFCKALNKVIDSNPEVAHCYDYSKQVASLTVAQLRLEWAAIRDYVKARGGKVEDLHKASKVGANPTEMVLLAAKFAWAKRDSMTAEDYRKYGICPETDEPCTPRKPCYYCKGEAASARRMEAEYR